MTYKFLTIAGRCALIRVTRVFFCDKKSESLLIINSDTNNCKRNYKSQTIKYVPNLRNRFAVEIRPTLLLDIYILA